MSISLKVGDDGVAEVLLDRAEAGNAIDLAFARRFLEVANELHAHGGVRAVLLRGAGKRFCVGGDLASFQAVPSDQLGNHLEELLSYLHAGIVRLQALDAPLVVAAQGAAAGAGFSLACAADLLVLGDDTTMVMAYAAVGLTPDGSGSWFLPRLVGLGRALDLALTNRRLSADEALEWGIASRVVPAAELDKESRRLAEELAAGPTRSLGAAKRLLHQAFTTSLPQQLHDESRQLGRAAGQDGLEGIDAFLGKRQPNFRQA